MVQIEEFKTVMSRQKQLGLFRRCAYALVPKSCAMSYNSERGVAVVQIADFKTVVFRQKQLGFNAVRLPFTFSDLNLTPKSWTKSCTDDTASLKVNSSPNSDALKLIMYVGRAACQAQEFIAWHMNRLLASNYSGLIQRNISGDAWVLI